MDQYLTAEKKRDMFRKRAYYHAHPEEAHDDRMRSMQEKSDSFIMKKVKEWEKSKEHQ